MFTLAIQVLRFAQIIQLVYEILISQNTRDGLLYPISAQYFYSDSIE